MGIKMVSKEFVLTHSDLVRMRQSSQKIQVGASSDFVEIELGVGCVHAVG